MDRLYIRYFIYVSLGCLLFVLLGSVNKKPGLHDIESQTSAVLLGREQINTRTGSMSTTNHNIQVQLQPQDVFGLNDDLQRVAPCGQVCSYTGTIVNKTAKFFPLMHKEIDCDVVMKRMAFRNHRIVNPPPKVPPLDLLSEFTMDGEMPITGTRYYNDIQNISSYFTKEDVEGLIYKLHKGKIINKYRKGQCVQNTLLKYASHIRGLHGVVIGTLTPWLEAILLAYGAHKVTSLEYSPLTLAHSKLDTCHPYTFATNFLQRKVTQFDFGATFSSLEHSGLGRYGDPINPYGDLEAMAQAWCMIKPGGMMAVGVPGLDEGKPLQWGVNSHTPANPHEGGQIIWNAHRIYGKKRLQQLTANWEVTDMVQCENDHVFLILRKPDL